MINMKESVKATIGKSAIFCGKCGHKIAACQGLKTGFGNGKIFLMCRHKSSGNICRTINEINL